MSNEEAIKILEEWTDRLGLQNWVISLNPCCKQDEMTEPESTGCTTWNETIRTARIEILDPQYYGDDRITPFDWEKTLVHELLHIKTCFISSECDILQERIAHQLIDDLARAFVDAKRNQK